ncbi:hypothetical protein [Labilibacter marinus]|uniref:hypothetical protein n=1 Tax=Labilibacter marinus TaxID=1477105 RepID=UPI00082A3C91|nr:hypothetical protein [Labilibacter marinus]
MNQYLILLLLLILASCSNKKDKNKNHFKEKNIDTVAKIIAYNETKTVEEIVKFIDSIYVITSITKVDTLKDWSVLIEEEYDYNSDTALIFPEIGFGYGPKALNLTELKSYLKYLSFDFLLFKDSISAQQQFNRILNSESKLSENSTVWNNDLYWKVFSKGGSSYILYDKMIIYHDRRCNYNEKIETPREEQLLDYLFNNQFPNKPYFARVKCGYSGLEIK